jgi:hypothetical protein
LLVLPLGACSLSRGTLGARPLDASPMPDAFAIDAPLPTDDVTVLPDAFVPPDMGMDTGPSCIATGLVETACDRIDDDCDGTIDDDGICGGCIAFTIPGHAYLSCPGPISGMQAWTGQCGAVAPGYDLATFDTPTDQMAVSRFLAMQIATDPHWIGLNDFAAPNAYVWRDRSTTFVPGSIAPSDMNKRFVVLRNDNGYEQASATDMHRFLCEATRAPGACAAHEASGCNGVDENCDGRVDEGQNCGAPNCMSRVFWDHVYYLCARNRKATEAPGDCTGIGAQTAIASIDDPVEHLFLAQLSTNDAWIGLTQDPAATTPDGGWRWADGSTTYALPPVRGVAPWDTNEPNDLDNTENHQEDCGVLLAMTRGDHFDDRACDAMLPFLCERSWSY